MLRKSLAGLGVTAFVLFALGVFASLVLTLGITPLQGDAITESSMGRDIPRGSYAVIDRGHYHIGQPVRLEVEGKTVTHRLIGFQTDPKTGVKLTVTQGAANPEPDPWHVPVSQIDGGVVFHVPYLGWLFLFLWSPLGIILLTVVSLTALVLMFRRPTNGVVATSDPDTTSAPDPATAA